MNCAGRRNSTICVLANSSPLYQGEDMESDDVSFGEKTVHHGGEDKLLRVGKAQLPAKTRRIESGCSLLLVVIGRQQTQLGVVHKKRVRIGRQSSAKPQKSTSRNLRMLKIQPFHSSTLYRPVPARYCLTSDTFRKHLTKAKKSTFT